MLRSVRCRARALAGELIRGMGRWAASVAAIGPNDPPAREYGYFGSDALIGYPGGVRFGERWIHIGSDTLIAPYVTLSAGMAPGQDMVGYPVVRIGERCLIGRGTAIVGHLSIDIADDVFTGMNVYITDQNHRYDDVDVPIGRQWPIEEAVSIGRGAWIGSGAVILPGARIGAHVVVAANSVVRGQIPARSVVAGVPARVVRRYEDGRWSRVP